MTDLRPVGAIWKPKPDAKSKGTGTATVVTPDGTAYRQRFVIMPNEYKEPGDRKPDYVLLSSDPAEVDEYETARQAEHQDEADEPERPIKDSIPFYLKEVSGP